MTFEAAMQALTDDAKRWDGVADVTRTAADSAGSLSVRPSQFSFAGGAVSTSFEEIRSVVEGLLRGGSAEMAGAATALRQVRATYEGTDEAAKQRLAGTWDWD
ncbi:hypothetical protein KIN34_03010 [Cellulomonas sp. DKR-3]|uniref:Excreted virulence factor EspC (Type VII ESX diderm) n=1 Tax=Cellulomonas fulva TaxID=2835530 RepID=A0ABS5TVT5_9CELL|nr:hypothetical protein [Cellulomonas fulva]MBT0993258.1 hypothetical protein [Cellulomonas fulva]